jgi:hypothetical protein
LELVACIFFGGPPSEINLNRLSPVEIKTQMVQATNFTGGGLFVFFGFHHL